jgi:alpha-glucosidase
MTNSNSKRRQSMQHTMFFLLFVLPALFLSAQRKVQVSSPDGRLVFSFRLAQGNPQYSIKFKGQILVNQSPLGLTFKDGADFTKHIRTGKPTISDKTESYELVVGKTKFVNDAYREVVIPMEKTTPPFRRINFVARVFSDGVAFRYEMPAQRCIHLRERW